MLIFSLWSPAAVRRPDGCLMLTVADRFISLVPSLGDHPIHA
jgi:hypothetical protein